MSIFDALSDFVHDVLGGTKSSDLADLGADPKQVAADKVPDVGAVAFPNASGSTAMQEVNAAMAKATTAYNEGREIAHDAPKAPTAGRQAQAFIDGTMKATPEQLDAMGGRLGALHAGEEIRADVGRSHGELLASKSDHAQRVAEEQAKVHAKSVEAAARAAAERAKD